MNVLMPMAGAGKRFSDVGYKKLKPLIDTTERRNGKKYPMVICAMHDLPIEEKDNLIFVVRTDYGEDISKVISKYYSRVKIIGVDHLTEGQACTCLLAESYIDNEDQLFIGGCDNGMVYDNTRFRTACPDADVLIFTCRNNEAVLSNPNAYGWVITEGDSVNVTGVSVKKAISSTPLKDHVITSSFWFKRGMDFVRCAHEMIDRDDRINGEFYVDQVIKYCLLDQLVVKVFEIDRYIGWGTPNDYETYEATIEYWRNFTKSGAFLAKE